MGNKKIKFKIPKTKLKNTNPDVYFKNVISSYGFGINKYKKAKKLCLKIMSTNEFGLRNIFFASVARKRRFGNDSSDVESAIGVLANKSVTKIFYKTVLIVHNSNKSLVVYFVKDKGKIWASTRKFLEIGYFMVTDPQCIAQYHIWAKEAVDESFEEQFLKGE